MGIFVFLVLTGCSKKDKTLNVEGAFTPVIEDLSSDHEPPVRGDVNALTAVVTNPGGYTIHYHWSAGAGVLADSTTATVHWTPPDSIGTYPVTVSIQAHDDLNKVDFFKTRTFQVYVDNQFQRWTQSVAVQFDVAPPAGGKIYYSEIRNAATGESDVWALAAPLGVPQQITQNFWQATQPTAQSDGSRIAFMAKVHASDGGASIWMVPAAGGDTSSASIVIRWTSNSNRFVGGPRFAPSGSMIAYSTDTIPTNFFHPKLWMRDAGNFAAAPIPVQPTTTSGGSGETPNAYWNPSWRGTGDSLVVESYANFSQNNQVSRGLFKFSASGNPPTNPEPFAPWLSDLASFEPDWSPDGQHIVFSRRSPGQLDRDIWIINAGASDISAARRVTFGPADEFHPRFSSDGASIFFVSNRVDGYGANGFYDTERRGTNIWSVSRFDLP
jgi:Tol biopolymer transport system component